MIIQQLIEKVEGEAILDFTLDEGLVADVKIGFGLYRGIEEILRGKAPRDALVITPRVCGICNHAHLIAAVEAIENGYRNAGVDVSLSDKAVKVREFTLACELIQNHVKWLYLTIIPQCSALFGEVQHENEALKAAYLSHTVTKAMAIFSGQWPHSSYAVPGGVTCDPTYVDVMQAQGLIAECIRFFEQVMTGIDFERYLNIASVSSLSDIGGDVGELLQLLGRHGMAQKGFSHDRFIVFGEGLGFQSGKSVVTTVSKVDPKYVEESPIAGSVAKAVTYKKRQYETGPLARGMVAKTPIVKSLHKRYKDSLMTRVFARIHEVALLLEQARILLEALDVREPSCTLESRLLCDAFEGIGCVEAARGSLIHKTTVKKRKIVRYEIIVPTQWNLGNGTEKERGVAVEAMVGSQSMEEASFIFRTFDVCSVCTAQ